MTYLFRCKTAYARWIVDMTQQTHKFRYRQTNQMKEMAGILPPGVCQNFQPSSDLF